MLRKPWLQIQIICLLIVWLLGNNCLQAKESQFQYRFGAGLAWGFRPDWELKLRQSIRHLEGRGGIYHRASDVGVAYGGIAPWLDVGLSFKAVFEENSAGETFQQNRPYLNVNVSGDLEPVSISNRIRLEYRDNEAKADLWKTRNRLKVEYPLILGKWDIAHYLADEVFLNMADSQKHSNRIIVGTSAATTEVVEASIYHFWDNSRTKRVRAIGFGLTCQF